MSFCTVRRMGSSLVQHQGRVPRTTTWVDDINSPAARHSSCIQGKVTEAPVVGWQGTPVLSRRRWSTAQLIPRSSGELVKRSGLLRAVGSEALKRSGSVVNRRFRQSVSSKACMPLSSSIHRSRLAFHASMSQEDHRNHTSCAKKHGGSTSAQEM